MPLALDGRGLSPLLYAQRAATGAGVLVLRETRTVPVLRPAGDVAVTILEQRFGLRAGERAEAHGLFDFQREGVARARAILARRRGVLVADSVGLGKTHVAVALARPVLEGGGRVAIVGPAALEGHWRKAVVGQRGVDWLSYGRLSRGLRPAGRYDMVVLDEAHALRNPTTRRYRAALELCRDTPVVLLSATPVNNSTWDLYHLLRLFARDQDFGDVGVASLRCAFERATQPGATCDPTEIRTVLRAVMIRRGREQVADAALRFPEQQPPVLLRYELALTAPDALEQLGALLADLDFPAHAAPRDRLRQREDAPVALMRLGLLKRLESSVHAFRRSLGAYEALLVACLDGLGRGLLVRARERPAAVDDAQLTLDELLFERVQSDDVTAAYRAALVAERTRVARMAALLGVDGDPKLEALLRLLRETLAGRRVVVFTQFRDTARYLHAALLRRCRVGLVDGSGALLGADAADRRAVIACFAPHANGARAPREHERLDVLVATDVLSEGFNLQDADVVLSYDLPWNPIRLVQRVGRIDRLGSRHRSVASYHFLPGDLERYLGIVERIGRKIVAIDASVGTDSPVLHMDLVRALNRSAVPTNGATPLLDPRGDARLDVDARLLAALARARSPGLRNDEFAVACVENGSGEAGSCGLVAARVGARFEWVAVCEGRVLDDDRECARLIERALAANGTGRPDPGDRAWLPVLERLLDVVRPVLARRGATATTGALLPAGGHQGRLGRRLLALAGALPGGPDGPTCARIERALAGLAALPPDRLADLAPLGRQPAADLSGLLAQVERAVARAVPGVATRGVAGAPDAPARAAAGVSETPVRLLGALLFRASSVDAKPKRH